MRMADKRVRGLFLTGTDTDVGKTYVGALIAAACAKRDIAWASTSQPPAAAVASGTGWSRTTPCGSGKRRAVPARWRRSVRNASPPRWRRTWRPGRKAVASIPNNFATAWTPGSRRSDVVLVEGAGGLLSPLGEDEYVADLASDLGYPLVVVARNVLGTINHTLQTLFVASRYRGGLAVAGVVLNHPVPPSADDLSVSTNRQELSARADCPILDEVAWQAATLSPAVDWFGLAR